MRIYKFSSSEFSLLKDQWQELLFRSGADRLFLSWQWMYSWWEVYGNQENDKLLLIGVYDDNDRLICLAPLYKSLYKLKKFIPITRIQFLGTKIGGYSGFRTEYLQFIADFKYSEESTKLILRYLVKHVNFDELWLKDLVVNSNTYQNLSVVNHKKKLYRRLQSKDYTYGINVKDDFMSYIESLGKNSRLKVYNRRKVLNILGNITLESVDAGNYKDIFPILTDFHLPRWEISLSYNNHVKFISKLINDGSISPSGIVIRLDNEPVGCTFDIISGDRSYNLQIGYLNGINKKISMGSLTLGYATELYCNDPEIMHYDLLAGEGKNTNYKVRIANEDVKLESLQIVSNPFLQIAYKLKDKLDFIKDNH